MGNKRKRRRRRRWPQVLVGSILGAALVLSAILAHGLSGRAKKASETGAETLTEASRAEGMSEEESTEAMGEPLPEGEGDIQEGAPASTETVTIYDIEEGYLTVPFYPELPRHGYDWGQLAQIGHYRYYAPGGQPASRIGVDVSKYQGGVDWQQVKGSGIQFAIIRLGYRGYSNGGLRTDERYRENMAGAAEAGLDLGVYFFSQAVNVQEAVEEAEFALGQISGHQLAMPVVFDTEEIKNDTSRTQGLSVQELTDITNAFCARIREAGYQPMVYANAKWLTTKLDLRQLKDIPIWYADYQEQPIYPYAFRMWQYTDTGQVPGIDGPADLNIWFE